MRVICYVALFTTACALTGCGTVAPSGKAWPQSSPLHREVEAYQPDNLPPPMEAAVPQAPDPVGALTLRDAIAAALRGSPELATYGYDVRSAEAQVAQAGLWNNPEAELEIEDFAGSGELDGVDALEATLVLSQTFPLGGDIRYRQKLARLESRLAGWDYESARVSLLAEVTQRYIDVLAAQERLKLAEESVSLTERVQDSITRRIDAGDAPAVERSRAAVPVVLAQIERERAERRLEAARVRLATTWGSNAPRFDEVRGELSRLYPVPSAEQLTALVTRNPDVARYTVEIASRQAQVELARAEGVPDITGSLGFRWFNESDDTAFVAGISMPLPVFDRRQGDTLAARFGVASARNRKRAVELQLTAALTAAYARMSNARAEAEALAGRALPPAEAAYHDIQQAFDRGNLGFLDVLEAERTLIELREAWLVALAEYHGAVAELEGLIGQSLTDIAVTQSVVSDISEEPNDED